MSELVKQYEDATGGEPVPLMEILGNAIYYEKFGCDLTSLYLYCIENKVKWEDVLDFHPEEFYNTDPPTMF